MSEDTMTVDESPQPITDVKKKRRRRLIYLVVAAVLWYVIAFKNFTGDAFIYGENPGIYRLLIHREVVDDIVIATPVVASILSLLIPGFLREKYVEQLLIGLILAILLVGFLSLLGPVINPVRHVQTLQYGDHIYYLAERSESTTITRDVCIRPDYKSHIFPGYFATEYLVYQCGQHGIMCQGIGCVAFDEYSHATHGKLSVDAEGHIVLAVDNKWFWTYPADEQ